MTRGLAEAKKIGKRALAIIDFKDDISQMNLYKVLINLDFYFGSDAGMKETFRSALGGCDHGLLCQHMIDLYKGRDEWETAEGFAVLNLKKSRKSPTAWSDYIRFLYEWRRSITDTDAGAKIDQKISDTMQRALQSMLPSEHKFFYMKKAGMEYKIGEIEKGRTTLETLVGKHPNKGDIWYDDSYLGICM